MFYGNVPNIFKWAKLRVWELNWARVMGPITQMSGLGLNRLSSRISGAHQNSLRPIPRIEYSEKSPFLAQNNLQFKSDAKRDLNHPVFR